ncbi:MAG: hypothetical protein KC766_35720 [Myxococcales bacterium]|nr:hypothetical protein [Myxococcales bacterium]
MSIAATSPVLPESQAASALEAKAKAKAPPKPSPEILDAARKFEAIFVRQLLSSLEKTTQMGGEKGTQGSVYGSMVVSSMADSISAAGGLGLGELVAQAMMQAEKHT